MLHFIREKAQGWIAWFIVGLIAIPFALWGVNSYITGPSDVVVATVNGEPIKQAQFQQSLQQYRDQMRNMLGDRFDPALVEGPAVKQNVLQSLIDQQLILTANQELGQQINDSEIAKFIKSTPAFQRDGKFDPEYYSMVLARAGFNQAGYESQLKIDLLAQELTDNVQSTTIVTDTAIDEILRLEKQQREIAYGVVAIQAFLDQVEVTDAEVKQYYDTNQAAYIAPEQVAINYLRLSVNEVAKQIDIDESDVKQFYADNQEKFVGPEQRRVSHILLEGDSESTLEAVQALKKRIDAGEDFASVAIAESADSGSASDGGDLGFIQRGVMDAAFEEAAFSLINIGDVSEPVASEFGYHLIKLTDVKAPEGKSYQQAKDQAEGMMRRQKAEELFYEQAEQLANLTYENPESLEVAAEALGMDIQSTQLFSRSGGTGLLENKKVVEAAFSDDVLNQDLNSTVIELDKTDLLVMHKKQHIAAAPLPYDSVAPAIAEQIKFDKASQQARDKGEAILADIKSGQAAQTRFTKGQWHSAAFYDRNSDKVSAQVLEQAFSLAKPVDAPQYTGFTANNGNYIVVALSAIKEVSPASASQEERDGLKSHMLRITGTAELEAFLESLRAGADIEINSQQTNTN